MTSPSSARSRRYLTGRRRPWIACWLLAVTVTGAATGASDGRTYIYAAAGFMGQYIFVVPEHDMVVVVTGGTRSFADQLRPVGFLYSHILPSIARR